MPKQEKQAQLPTLRQKYKKWSNAEGNLIKQQQQATVIQQIRLHTETVVPNSMVKDFQSLWYSLLCARYVQQYW